MVGKYPFEKSSDFLILSSNNKHLEEKEMAGNQCENLGKSRKANEGIRY